MSGFGRRNCVSVQTDCIISQSINRTAIGAQNRNRKKGLSQRFNAGAACLHTYHPSDQTMACIFLILSKEQRILIKLSCISEKKRYNN